MGGVFVIRNCDWRHVAERFHRNSVPAGLFAGKGRKRRKWANGATIAHYLNRFDRKNSSGVHSYSSSSDSFHDTGLWGIGVLDQSIGGIDQDRTFLPGLPEYRRPVPRELENDGAEPKLKRALEHIAANSTSKISVQVLAEIAGITPHHFSAVFTRKTGLTPHQFILRTRIECAKAYLPDQAHSIREISKLTGFRTQEHFTKVFRKVTGITPTQFRTHSARR